MLELSLASDAAPVLLGALVSVGEQAEHPRVRRWLRFVAEELGVGASHAIVGEAPNPQALAQAIPEAARVAALERLVLAAMLVPPLSATRLDTLEAYAHALGLAAEPALLDLRRTLGGRHRRLAASLLRRFPPTERIRVAWRRGSFGERGRFLKAMLRLPDAATATRYRALGELGEDTLGRRFFEHCRRNSFPLPGERRGLPEAMVFHDMGHALVGAATDIAGETWMAGFEAGCMGERGFTMIEFTLLLFNLGARLPTDAAPAVDVVDLDILLAAYAEGRRSCLDVLAWDPWPDTGEPVAALRERYGIARGPR
jgi:hypothetical protein